MQVWNLLHGARCKYRTQKVAKKSPSGHHRTTLSDYIFATKARIDNQKKNLLSSSISSTCSHNMVNFGPLAAEIVSLVWGTPANFNGFRFLAALLHGTLVVGVSQTSALNRGRHLYSAGRPSRWALAHILVVCYFLIVSDAVWCGVWITRASVYLTNIYYGLDVMHRVAVVNGRGVVVGHLQVAVQLLSSERRRCFAAVYY